ncbi:MAG: SpoIIIAC/SpoIIIAD family protein [Clostridia bacterium]|nr:SpoIIIAC/SpoIIIAD family protein [Clostridia bacterium]MDD4375864.1 SpoIIIAC/SpoIIIAD family protein [Clostridia bacterium]
MEILKLCAFTIIALVLIILVKKENKEIGVTFSIFVTVIIASYGIIKLNDVISLLYNLIENSGINAKYLEVILKVVGIAYIVELTKDVCIDSGESALGSKVEIVGKIIITVMTIPIVIGVIDVINKLI